MICLGTVLLHFGRLTSAGAVAPTYLPYYYLFEFDVKLIHHTVPVIKHGP